MEKRFLRQGLLLIMFVLVLPDSHSQYNISFNIPDFKNDSLLFGHYFSETLILKDTFFLDNEGKGVIRGEKSLPAGMYTVYFPNRSRFDLIVDADQDFSVSTDTTDLLKHTVIKGSRDNELFYEYLGYLDEKRKASQGVQSRIQVPVSTGDSIEARKEMDAINKEVKSYVEGIIEKAGNSFLSVFLLSMKEIEVPDPPKNENGEVIDKNFQANYYKQHYFDYFDLSDARLLRTPVYERKIMDYLDRWIYPIPDSIYTEVDFLIEESRSDSLLFKYMLTTLFNYYAKSKYVGMDAVYAYIGEKYYIPEAYWSSPDFIEKLKERVAKINPLIIGKKGPDIRLVKLTDDQFQMAEGDTAMKRNPYIGDFFNLYQINSKYLVLYFWEADCGHCKKTIPELHEMYEKMKDKGLEVIAVSMLGGVEGKEKWTDFVNEHGLYGWINAWNPYDFSYKEAYDVSSSNILYLLDENKEILAKKISPEQVEEIINRETERESELSGQL